MTDACAEFWTVMAPVVTLNVLFESTSRRGAPQTGYGNGRMLYWGSSLS